MELDIIDLDEISEFSNYEIFEYIKYLIHCDEYNSFEKILFQTLFIRHISDENLFKTTKQLFENTWLYTNASQSNNKISIDNSIDFGENVAESKDPAVLKFEVCVFGISILKEMYSALYDYLSNDAEMPILNFKVENRKLIHNLPEIQKIIKRKGFVKSKNQILNLQTKSAQENEIKKLILSISTIDFENNTNTFEDEIKHFQLLLNNLPEPTAELQPIHDEVFCNNGFELFDYLLNQNVRPKGVNGRQADIAHYYLKMFNNEPKYIHSKQEAFKMWFFKQYDKEYLGKFHTESNLKNIHRDRHYSNALDWFKRSKK
jgi:hypothetical protein